MSTIQPHALRLAAGLESIFISEEVHATKAQAIAAELRRLHQSEREGWRHASELEQERKRLHARIADLESQLVKEAARSADEKRRADQMTEQHRMQAAMNAEARAKLASIGAGYTAADMATAAAQGFRDGVASVAAGAGSEPVAQPTEDVRKKIQSNTWDHFGAILPTLKAISRGDWYWGANSRCKYIEIRLDTRDGGGLIYDRERVRISPEQFAHQGRAMKMEPWPVHSSLSAAPQPAVAVPNESEKAIRRLLCSVYAGPLAYTDDGEAQDNREHPHIDFMRDSADEIQAKMRQRNLTKLSPAAQAAPAVVVPAGWKLVPVDATDAMVRATDGVNFANGDTDGTMYDVWHAMLAAAPQPQAPVQEPKRVYLVHTGEEHEGEATYTRHDDAPPPLCDAECLYTHPAPAVQGEAVLAYLDGLSDDAAAHIFPDDLQRCATRECTATVYSVRVGSPDGKTVPLYSREQVAEALAAQKGGE